MGGSQNIGEASDNPVEINVTAMVDVIFCLCIFFMCSFHFKQLEGKIDTWLPGPGRPSVTPLPPPPWKRSGSSCAGTRPRAPRSARWAAMT